MKLLSSEETKFLPAQVISIYQSLITEINECDRLSLTTDSGFVLDWEDARNCAVCFLLQTLDERPYLTGFIDGGAPSLRIGIADRMTKPGIPIWLLDIAISHFKPEGYYEELVRKFVHDWFSGAASSYVKEEANGISIRELAWNGELVDKLRFRYTS